MNSSAQEVVKGCLPAVEALCEFWRDAQDEPGEEDREYAREILLNGAAVALLEISRIFRMDEFERLTPFMREACLWRAQSASTASAQALEELATQGDPTSEEFGRKLREIQLSAQVVFEMTQVVERLNAIVARTGEHSVVVPTH